jgi:hypothetical protein
MMILALAGLLACRDKNGSDDSAEADADTDADTDSDTDTDTDTDACTATVTAVAPDDGSTNVATDSVILAVFSAAADAATITVSDGTKTVAGTTALQGDGSSATFTPDAALARDTTYEVDVAVCDATWNGSFTTLPDGVAPEAIENHTYDFDFATATWLEPTLGSTLVDYFAANHMLLMVEDVDDVALTLDFLGAAGFEPTEGTVEQYQCSDNADFTPADFSTNPAFALGPEAFGLAGDGYEVEIHDVFVSGRFAADGSAVEDAHVEGLVDLRDITIGIGSACEVVELLGGDCVACPDGQPQCLESVLEWDSAPEVPGLVLGPPTGEGC